MIRTPAALRWISALRRDLAFARRLPGAALRDIRRSCWDLAAHVRDRLTEDPACRFANLTDSDQGDL